MNEHLTRRSGDCPKFMSCLPYLLCLVIMLLIMCSEFYFPGKRQVTLDVYPFELNEGPSDVESLDDLESQVHGVLTAAESPPLSDCFQCEKCTYRSQRKNLFDRHCARHSMDSPYECTLCDYSIVDHSTFVDHLALHQQSNVIQCPFCPHESCASAMRLHMLRHKALEMFDCSSCEFSSNSAKSLSHHDQANHNQQFKCEYCGKRMAKYSLIGHWNEAHGIREVSTESAKEPDVQWGLPPSPIPGSRRSMLYPEVIVKSDYGKLKEDGFPSSVEPEGVNVEESSADSQTEDFTDDEIETFSCRICEFSSHLKVLLKYHILSMHTKKVACKHCSALMTKHALIQHSKNAHGAYFYFDGKGLREATFQSKKSVDSPASLKDGPKPQTLVRNSKEREVLANVLRSGDKFICSICHYSTPQKKHLEQHIDNLHRRKYCCNKCPAIMTKFALVEHARLKHGETLKIKNRFIIEVKPGVHSSPVFGAEAERGPGLDVEPERADNYSKSSRVQITRTIVQRGNVFICSACEYSSTWRPQLDSHVEKLHVRQYHCKHCPEVMNKYDLIEHSMAKHGVSMSVKTPGLKEFRQELNDGREGLGQDWQNTDDRELNDSDFNRYDTSIPSGVNDPSNVAGRMHGKPFACSVCHFTAHSDWSLTCHMKFMHLVKYHCNHCPEVMTKYDIIKHSWDEHGVEILPRGPSGLRPAKEDLVSQGGVRNFCVAEGTMFSGDNFLGHFKDDSPNQSVPNMHEGDMEANDPMPCGICDFVGNSPSKLTTHMDIFHKKKFYCPYCPAVMSKHELEDHSLRAHRIIFKRENPGLKEAVQDSDDGMAYSENDDLEYESSMASLLDKSTSDKACPHCEYVCRTSEKVRIHVERMHTIKFCCEHCRVVMTKYDLIQHYAEQHGHVLGRAYRSYKFKRATKGQVVEDQTRRYDGEPSKHKPTSRSFQSSESQGEKASLASTKGCSFCKYSSVVPKDVLNHEKRMHRLKFHCEHCPAVMVKYKLLQHCKTEHGIVHPKNYRFKEAISGIEQDDDLMDVLQSDEKKSLGRNTDSKQECSICGYLGHESSVEVHMERLHRALFHCRQCAAVMTKYDLIKHYNSAHGFAVSRFGHFIRSTDAVVSGSGNKDIGTYSPLLEKSGTPEMSGSGIIEEDLIESIQSNQDYSEPEEPQRNDASKDVSSEANDDDISSINNERGSFCCPLCDFSTKTDIALEIHKEKWHRRKYICNNCPEIMPKHDMIEHSKNVHGIILPRKGRPLQLLKPAAQDRSDLESGGHQLTNSSFTVDPMGETFKCNVCDYSSQHRKPMLYHVVTLHRKKYSCDYCSAVLTKHELIVHSKDAHGIDIPCNGGGYVFKHVTQQNANSDSKTGSNGSLLKPELESEDKYWIKLTQADGTTNYKCTKCEFTTLYSFNMKGHAECFHSKLFHCNTCPAVLTKYDLIQHYEEEHNVVFSNQKVRGQRFVEYHPGSNQSETKQYGSRDTDQQDSTTENNLTLSHDDDDHDNDEASFFNFVRARSRSTLNPEISVEQADDPEQFIRVGENNEVFSCKVCDFSSKYRKVVYTHFEKFHRKKFICGQCSAVMNKHDLIQHYGNIHNVTINNYGKGYVFKEANESSRCIEPYSEACSDGVQSGFNLTDGVRLNASEIDGYDNIVVAVGGKYKCSVCDHSTVWKSNMKLHFLNLHRKLYSCNRCSVILTKYDMIQHFETVHDVVISIKISHSSKYFREVDHDLEGKDESGDVVDGSVQGDPLPLESSSADDDVQSMTILQEGGEFKCSICGHSTVHKSNLQPHFEAFHQKKYSCNRCLVVLTKYGMVCHYETVHRFVIPNCGKGNLRPYCTAVGENSESMTPSEFADGTETDDSLTAEVDDITSDMVETVMDDNSTVVSHGDTEDEIVEIIKEGGEFKCSICGHSSTSKRNVRIHVVALHQKKYSCNRCSLIRTKYDMVRHYEIDHDVKVAHMDKGHRGAYFTAVGEVSEGMDSLVFANNVPDAHWLTGIDADDGKVAIIREGDEYKCSVCDYVGPKKSVKGHIVVLHKKKYSCNRCSVVLTKHEMIQHYDTYHNMVISIKGHSLKYFKDVVQDQVARDSSVMAGNFQEVSVAGGMSRAEFKSASEVISIIKEGKDGKRFRCSDCDFTSLAETGLRKHSVSMHMKTFSCNRCSVLMTKYDMIQHFKNDHHFEIPYNGRGMTSQYFSAVDQDSDVADLGCSEIHPAAVPSSRVAIENDPDVSAAVSHQSEFKCTECDFSSKYMEDLRSHGETRHEKKLTLSQSHLEKASHVIDDHASTVDEESTISSEDPQNLGNLSCHVCEFSTKYIYSMETHMVAMHKKQFSCEHCPAVLTKHELIKHYNDDHGVTISPFNHNLQQVVSPTKGHAVEESSEESGLPVGSTATKYFVSGVRSSNDDPDPSSLVPLTGGLTTFKCSSCDFSSRLRMHLQVHTRKMHPSTHSCNSVSSDMEPSNTDMYHCNHCAAIMTKQELISHSKNVHDVHINLRGSSLRKFKADSDSSKEYEDVSDSDVMVARKAFSCPICDFSTKAKWYLKDHMDKFHRRKYCCPHCPAVMSRHVLIKHCKDVHGLTCSSRQPLTEADDLNPKSSGAERSLKHVNHPGPSISSPTEASNTNQTVGQEIDNRAMCPICDFATPNKWYLNDHMTSFHKREYSCTQCSAVMTKYELSNHSLERHGFNININRRLPDAAYVDSKHGVNQAKSKRNVSSEFKKPKRYPCGVCSFSSFHPFGLKRHVNLHHTIKYPCQQCPAVMTRYALIKHCRAVHQTSENPPDEQASKVLNPKFQTENLTTVQRTALQPVVVLEKLPIEDDDLDSSFSIIDNSNPTDSAMLENPKFHDRSN